MENDLLLYLSKVLNGNLPVIIDKEAPPPQIELHIKLIDLICQVNEAYTFFVELANGNLLCKAPRSNALLGPAKDLQSSLKHLLWQVERVAAGDYTQQVEFLGDFSIAFNFYNKQIALREHYRTEAALLEKENLEQKNCILVQQLEQQLAYYETLTTMHQKVRGINHDIKNHCFALYELLLDNDIESAKKYLNGMASFTGGLTERVYNTGNPIFDVLITEKVNRARACGIEISVDIAVKPNMLVENIDWCSLLGNAMDNAIEACELLKPEKKIITIKIVVRKNTLSILICNSAKKPKKLTDGFYQSSKIDKAEHGLGLNNISHIVDKYNGVMETEFDKGHFTLICMLCGI